MKVEFRDGPREVPEHLGHMMRGLETQRLTYEEALEQANNGLLNRHLRAVESDIIRDHSRNWGR